MNDETVPDEKQKRAWVFEALEKVGFKRVGDMEIFTRPNGQRTLVVDLSAGKSVYFKDGNNRIDEDDEYGTLEVTHQILVDAEDGRIPMGHELLMDVDIPAKIPEPAPKPHNQPRQDPQVPAEVHRSTTRMVPFTPTGKMIQGLNPGLKEIGKIKIGRKGETRKGGKGEYRLPEKFDHFEVVTVHKDDKGDFISDTAIMNIIGSDAKELDVSLLYNDPTLNFPTRYNEYKGGKCMCSGNGVTARKADGTEIGCNPESCLTFKDKRCKPNGILSVILKDAPRLGGVYKFRTTSFNSIRSILSSMFFIQSLTGGILANIPLKMTVAPMSVNPEGSATAQTIYVVNLEYPGTVEDLHKQTVQLMTERASMQSKIAELEAQARLAIDEPETSEEIHDVEAEFYPEVS